MDDLDMLARDFGFGPRGKSNPMRSDPADRPRPAVRSSIDDPLFNDDVFAVPRKYSSSSNSNAYSNDKYSSMNDFDYDSIFKSSEPKKNNSSKTSSMPVYDKPVYDEDIFDGLPGIKSKPPSSTVKFDDGLFASISSPPASKSSYHHTDFDDLLGNFGRNEKVGENNKSTNANTSSSLREFDDLLAGFGGGSSATSNRPIPGSSWSSVPAAGSKPRSSVVDDPFVVLESTSTTGSSSSRVFTDPLEEITKLGKSRSASTAASSGSGMFDDLDPLNNFGNPVHSSSSERDNVGKDRIPSRPASPQSGTTREQKGNSSFGYSESNMEKKIPAENFQEPPLFDVPNVSADLQKSFGQTATSHQYNEKGSRVDIPHPSEEQGHQLDDIWLTVSEIPLFTQPTNAPPPSRAPPPIPHRTSRSDAGSSSSVRKEDYLFSPSSYPQHAQSPKRAQPSAKSSPVSQFDELEDFAKGLSKNNVDEGANHYSSEENNAASAAAASAAAMKEAMDKAEAKFRHAKELREREYAKTARNKESVQLEKDEQEVVQESEFRETLERLEHERKQKEEEEREQRRLERERLREIERERARQAVERATKEARERAAAEASERVAAEARLKAERAAVEKANAEARSRAERAAVQKVQAEARERAAAEAKERAERAAAEVRERAAAAEARERAAAAEAREKDAADKASMARAVAEARRRAERAAVERVAAEARERAAAEARERAAAAAKANQQKNDNDLDSIFNVGRASSAPRSRTDSTDPMFDQQFQTKGGSESVKRTPLSSGVSSNIKKASSTNNFVEDLSSIFGAAPSSGEFQEVEGEAIERRRARMDRHQRTQERAAKALAEKNQRDVQAQREQEERHRIADTLDLEIKRWAAGKEGNLRALLSTLQFVLWPECGWQPVSLTDLIMGASVKKTYRKATLCIHPDKVQQKGATLQQKYIAEKVFDLLKEAWNKFNSEELF